MQDIIISDYFYGDESELFSYFRIPRQLITHPRFKGVSTDAKLLYGMLLDRMGLSAKNGWYDAGGRVYIYYTVEEICEDLSCGRDKAMKLLAELDSQKGVGLIERVKHGQGRPTTIYVKRFTTQTVPPQQESATQISEVGFSDVQKSENSTSRSRNLRSQEVGKNDPNYHNPNKTEYSYPYLSIHPCSAAVTTEMDRCDLREEIRQNIDYDHLRRTYPEDEVECLLELIADILASNAPQIRIGSELLSTETVKRRFWQLDHSHISYVLDSMKRTTTEIRNIRAYLLTALYYAPVTIGSFYSAAVRHDFG